MKDGNGIYVFFFKTTDSVRYCVILGKKQNKKILVTAVRDDTKNNASFSGVTESKSVFFPKVPLTYLNRVVMATVPC